MMKKITLLSILLTVSFGYSQNAPIDFEDGGIGNGWTWTMDQNGANPALEFVTGEPAGTTSKVAKFTALDTGANWALCYSNDIGSFAFSSSNSMVKIKVYKTVISNVGIKFEGTSGNKEIQVANTLINQWEELEFNFSSVEGTTFTRIVIIPDFAPRDTDNIIYFDDITFNINGTPPPPAPTTAPTTPTADASDVKCLFSDQYTDIASIWNPAWGQSTIVIDETIASNPLKKYSSFNFSGIEPTGGTIDASTMTHINLDYWTSDATEIKIKLVDYRGDGAWGGDNMQVEMGKTTTTNSWQTLSIALSEYTNANASFILSDIGQLVLSAVGAANPVYLDNIYFSNNGTASVKDFEIEGLMVYPNPSNSKWTISTKNQEIQAVEVFNVLGKRVLSLKPNALSTFVDASGLTPGVYLTTITTAQGTSSRKLIKN